MTHKENIFMAVFPSGRIIEYPVVVREQKIAELAGEYTTIIYMVKESK